MFTKRMTIVFNTFLSLVISQLTYATNNPPVEFFASNNTAQISIQTAYDRLIDTPQTDLQNQMISVFQNEHIEQGRFEDILGAYSMSSDNKVTADNSERFSTSPYQKLSEEKLFSLAKELAITLNQDSVAVLIPNKSIIGEINVNFASHQFSINEVITILHDKLPASYSQAYSLHITNKYHGFDNAKVNSIEWLGSKMNVDEVKKAFPLENVNYQYGKVYLVYKNGQHEQI
jgi:hypothetical protein